MGSSDVTLYAVWTDMVLWLRAKGNATDSSGLGHNGGAYPWGSSLNFDAGKYGQAFSFNGTNMVAVTVSSSLNFGGGAFSGSLWIKTTSTTDAYLAGNHIPGIDNFSWSVCETKWRRHHILCHPVNRCFGK